MMLRIYTMYAYIRMYRRPVSAVAERHFARAEAVDALCRPLCQDSVEIVSRSCRECLQPCSWPRRAEKCACSSLSVANITVNEQVPPSEASVQHVYTDKSADTVIRKPKPGSSTTRSTSASNPGSYWML